MANDEDTTQGLELKASCHEDHVPRAILIEGKFLVFQCTACADIIASFELAHTIDAHTDKTYIQSDWPGDPLHEENGKELVLEDDDDKPDWDLN